MNFQQLPDKYMVMLKNINDKSVKNIYNIFKFSFLPIKTNQNIEEVLFKSIKNYKFMTYKFVNQNVLINKNQKLLQLSNFILCCEGECIIIEGIDKQTKDNIIFRVKTNLINVTDPKNDDIKQEIISLSKYFKKSINSNDFVKLTFHPIACFLVRRFFYPTRFFSNPDFFFYKMKNIDSLYFNQKFYDLLSLDVNKDIIASKIDKVLSYKKMEKQYDIFSEKDFIILRNIYKCSTAIIDMVFHIDSLRVFAMKKFPNQILEVNNDHEIMFCQKHSHRCFMHFYGFIKSADKIIGIIYEFMSKGSLNDYLKRETKQIDEIFNLMTIIRISQGIQYLNSQSLIHRDLKPANILINHDNLPFISDFETIREINDQEMTNDIGSMLYVSPEQYAGSEYSFPTDVYSFGLIIYFLFVHDDFKNLKNCNNITQLKKFNEKIELLFESCTKFNQSERINSDGIINLIYNEIATLKNFEHIINININDNKLIDIISFLYETICILNQFEKENIIKTYLFKYLFLLTMQMIKIDEYKSNALNNVGDLYLFGIGIEKNEAKAKEYYELSASLNNSYGTFNLGFLYSQGLGVKQNISKAMEYYMISANQNNPVAQNAILLHDDFNKSLITGLLVKSIGFLHKRR